jgi:hypothetical protein
MIISVTKNKELAACGILWDTNGTWVFQFTPDLCTIRVCKFMQANLAGLVLAALTIGNRRMQVAKFICFEAVKFGPSEEVDN